MIPAVWLILTVCGAASCQTAELPWDGSLMSCQVQAQQVIQAELRPGQRLQRYRCVVGRPA